MNSLQFGDKIGHFFHNWGLDYWAHTCSTLLDSRSLEFYEFVTKVNCHREYFDALMCIFWNSIWLQTAQSKNHRWLNKQFTIDWEAGTPFLVNGWWCWLNIVAGHVYHYEGKGWFPWMIAGCYLGRVTNLLALLWLIYGTLPYLAIPCHGTNPLMADLSTLLTRSNALHCLASKF